MPNKKIRLLLIDDDDGLRGMIRVFLERCGYDVSLASNGTEGIETFMNLDPRPRIVITDGEMPKVDGHEVNQQPRGKPTGYGFASMT